MQKIILIHGALGCAADMAPLQEALAGRLDAMAIELPGHGKRAGEGEAFSMAGFVADLDAALQRADAGLNLFGYSMGGYVALLYAAMKPQKVGRIFTLGAKLDWTPEGGQKAASRLNPDKIAEKAPQFATALAQRHGEQYWLGVVRQTAALLAQLGGAPDLQPAHFRQIRAQVCIARGELDDMVTEAECIEAASMMPHATYAPLAAQPHPFEQCDYALLAERLAHYFS